MLGNQTRTRSFLRSRHHLQINEAVFFLAYVAPVQFPIHYSALRVLWRLSLSSKYLGRRRLGLSSYAPLGGRSRKNNCYALSAASTKLGPSAALTEFGMGRKKWVAMQIEPLAKRLGGETKWRALFRKNRLTRGLEKTVFRRREIDRN